MKRFAGKVAVITGGSSGIGLAVARRLHAEGARVGIVGRRPERLEAAAREIGEGVLCVQADVSKLADIKQLAVAKGILDGVERDDEEIFPDPMTQPMAESWRSGAVKAMERQQAAFVAEAK